LLLYQTKKPVKTPVLKLTNSKNTNSKFNINSANNAALGSKKQHVCTLYF